MAAVDTYTLTLGVEDDDDEDLPREFGPDCPDCGAVMVLTKSRYGKFYGCVEFTTTGCKGKVSAHEDGTLSATPANQETRALRFALMQRVEQLLKEGATIPTFDKRVGDMTAEDCREALSSVHKMHMTAWDVLDGPGLI
jgi:ssDNA-binding Zn-finger/Zn-ribbon topoisomerase 1